MSITKKIYLAAPLFSVAEQEFNKKLENALEDLGFSVFVPQEDSNDTEAAREEMDSNNIFKLNVEAIDACDILVAVLDGGTDVDSGTAWEIGYAYAKEKTVVGIKTDFRTLGPEGLVNLMIEESADDLVTSVKDLLETMKKYS
ncbi:nucleoside 2-deoxyribosyltransferase domain-containing protein [Methanococcoides methylutens]|uniref:Nucleoside 2-deoxyribosyltransferase n=1 Tax=Methanococcoides methylutens MM1 TaxID=1434104 RepID=A0A0E3ST35_METMT|nr:nucleoside 2-deoxyribosyltransferase domain-containing protein [Methanococcoides methylutens]AKB85888.1 Nucleoside 2-deoxyribosyltransferase [Methanococcoides methylutens MM1]